MAEQNRQKQQVKSAKPIGPQASRDSAQAERHRAKFLALFFTSLIIIVFLGSLVKLIAL